MTDRLFPQPDDARYPFFVPFLIQKEELRRLYMLGREAHALSTSAAFLEAEVGQGMSQRALSTSAGSPKTSWEPRNRQEGWGPWNSLARVTDKAADDYRYFIGTFGLSNVGDKTRAIYLRGELDRYDLKLSASEPEQLILRFLCNYTSNRRRINQLLNVFARVRGRFAQEMEQYPPHIESPPRYHNRESTSTFRFLQHIVKAYDEEIRYVVGELLSGKNNHPSSIPAPSISLTFEYTRTSNIRTDQGSTAPTWPRYLLIESPYYYLETPKNAPILAHEVAHAYVNGRLFTRLKAEPRLLDYSFARLLLEMKEKLDLQYALTPIARLAPRTSEDIITELFADVLAMVVGGPYYLFSFLDSIAGLDDPQQQVGFSFNKYYRLHILTQLCRTLYIEAAPGGLFSAFTTAHLPLLESFLSHYRSALRHLPVTSKRRADYHFVWGFYETVSKILAGGFERMLRLIDARHAERQAESGEQHFLFLPTAGDAARQEVREWYSELAERTGQQAKTCFQDVEAVDLRYPPPIGVSVDAMPELFRLLPNLVWREAIAWNLEGFFRPLPRTATAGEGDRPAPCDVYGCLPSEGRVLHLAINKLNLCVLGQGGTSQGSNAIQPSSRIGPVSLLPYSIVRVRHVFVAPNPRETPRAAMQQILHRVVVGRAEGLGPPPHAYLAFGPADLIFYKEIGRRHTSISRLIRGESLDALPTGSVDAGSFFFRDYYYGRLDYPVRSPAKHLAFTPTTATDGALAHPWQAMLHIRTTRENVGSTSDTFSIPSQPFSTMIEAVNENLEEANRSEGTSAAVTLRAVLLGQGYWDLLFLVDFSDLYTFARFYQLLLAASPPPAIDRTMILLTTFVPPQAIARRSHFLFETEDEAQTTSRRDSCRLNDGMLMVTATQRAGFAQPRGNTDQGHSLMTGSCDSMVPYDLNEFFPDGKATMKSAKDLFGEIARLFREKGYLSSETSVQLNVRRPLQGSRS